MNIKLCPKCGGKAKLNYDGLVDYVICKKCGYKGKSFFDGADLAIKSWNLEASGRHWCPWKCKANESEWKK